MAATTLAETNNVRRHAYRTIQSLLVLKDSNMRKFANDHGFNEATVRQTILDYAGGTAMPRSRQRFRILLTLSRFVGEEVVTGIYEQAKRDAA